DAAVLSDVAPSTADAAGRELVLVLVFAGVRAGSGELAGSGRACGREVAPEPKPELLPAAERASRAPVVGRTAGRRGSPAGVSDRDSRSETGVSRSVRSVLGVTSGPTPEADDAGDRVAPEA